MSPLTAAATAALLLTAAVNAALVPRQSLATSPYAPTLVQCPTRKLVRKADRINRREDEYVDERRNVATRNLEKWLKKAFGDKFDDLEYCDLPTVAIALSGGGLKSGIASAGVLRAFDDREDRQTGLSGILQSATYISALSGGTIPLSGVVQNDFARISDLYASLWITTFVDPFQYPLSNISAIQNDTLAKKAAGYRTSLLDLYGRTWAYNFIGHPNAPSAASTWSGVVDLPSFKNHEQPFPLFTLTDALINQNQCSPRVESPIFEVSPYEFGSWAPEVDAFIPTKFLGTTFEQGKPKDRRQCTRGFDNTGFLAATSSNILGRGGASNCTASIAGLGNVINAGFNPGAGTEANPYAVVPNPFYGAPQAGSRSNESTLYMLDGGSSFSGIPITPFLQPERDIDVIFAVDTSSTGGNNLTVNGGISFIYAESLRLGTHRMPAVPDPATFTANALFTTPLFFGCRNASQATVLYFPNSYSGFVSSGSFQYPPATVQRLLTSGEQMVTRDADPAFPACVACAVMHKQADQLPAACAACLAKYCWFPANATASA